MADLILLPIHYHKEYMNETCRLINREWQRTFTARYLSLSTSCDRFPTSLVLVNQKTNRVVGHVKASAVKTVPDSCYIESVVIDQMHRGKGWGLELMHQLHSYLVIKNNIEWVYLSTKGQEKFYMKLGYEQCEPISLYGTFPPSTNQKKSPDMNKKSLDINKMSPEKTCPAPPPLPPPMIIPNGITINTKTFMRKNLKSGLQ